METARDGRPRVHVGDRVRVSGAAGVVEFVVVGGADPVVCGRLRAGGTIRLDLRDFDRVEVRRVEPWPTVAVNAVGLTMATLATLAGYFFLASISE